MGEWRYRTGDRVWYNGRQAGEIRDVNPGDLCAVIKFPAVNGASRPDAIVYLDEQDRLLEPMTGTKAWQNRVYGGKTLMALARQTIFPVMFSTLCRPSWGY